MRVRVSRVAAAFAVLGGVMAEVACAEDHAEPARLSVVPDPLGKDRDLFPPGTIVGSPCAPAVPPNAGELCNKDQVPNPAVPESTWDGTCEYGHDLERACNEVFRCDGTWSAVPRSECFGRCPDVFAAIVEGDACNAAMACSYVEGTCACVQDADGGPRRWRCAAPPTGGCPAQRPPLLSDCVRDMTCDYGSCTLGIDATFRCRERRWIQVDSCED